MANERAASGTGGPRLCCPQRGQGLPRPVVWLRGKLNPWVILSAASTPNPRLLSHRRENLRIQKAHRGLAWHVRSRCSTKYQWKEHSQAA